MNTVSIKFLKDDSGTKGLYGQQQQKEVIGSRVVSVLDSGAEGPGFKSHPRRCRVAVLGKLFTPIVLLSLGSTRADDFLAYRWLFYLLLPLSRRC